MTSTSSQKSRLPFVASILPEVLEILAQNVASGRWARFREKSGLSRQDMDIHARQRLTKFERHLCAAADSAIGTGLDVELRRQLRQDRGLRYYALIIHDGHIAHHETILALQRGDIQAWEALRDHLLVQVQGILRRRVSRTAGQAWRDAEDVVQKVCIEILASRFPYDVTFDSWCGRLMVNQFHLLHTRTQDVHDRGWQMVSLEALEERADGAAHTDPLRLVEQRERRKRLHQALTRIISPDRQKVLESTFFQGRADEEIARQMGKSRISVQVLRHRALRDLRTTLDPEMFAL